MTRCSQRSSERINSAELPSAATSAPERISPHVRSGDLRGANDNCEVAQDYETIINCSPHACLNTVGGCAPVPTPTVNTPPDPKREKRTKDSLTPMGSAAVARRNKNNGRTREAVLVYDLESNHTKRPAGIASSAAPSGIALIAAPLGLSGDRHLPPSSHSTRPSSRSRYTYRNGTAHISPSPFILNRPPVDLVDYAIEEKWDGRENEPLTRSPVAIRTKGTN